MAPSGPRSTANQVRQRTQLSESKNTSLAHVGQCRRFTRGSLAALAADGTDRRG